MIFSGSTLAHITALRWKNDNEADSIDTNEVCTAKRILEKNEVCVTQNTVIPPTSELLVLAVSAVAVVRIIESKRLSRGRRRVVATRDREKNILLGSLFDVVAKCYNALVHTPNIWWSITARQTYRYQSISVRDNEKKQWCPKWTQLTNRPKAERSEKIATKGLWTRTKKYSTRTKWGQGKKIAHAYVQYKN